MHRVRTGPNPDPNPDSGPGASPCPAATNDEEAEVDASFPVEVPLSNIADDVAVAVVDARSGRALEDVLKGCVVKRTSTSSAAVTVVDGLPREKIGFKRVA